MANLKGGWSIAFLKSKPISSYSSQSSNALCIMSVDYLQVIHVELIDVIELKYVTCDLFTLSLVSVYSCPFSVRILKAHMLKTFCVLWNQSCLKYPTGQVWPHSFLEASDNSDDEPS